jgi:hypothetical protein
MPGERLLELHVNRELRFGSTLRLLTLATSLLACSGCSDFEAADEPSRPRYEGWSQRQLEGVTPDRAYQAGIEALRQWFVKLETDRPGGIIRAHSTEYTQKGGTERLRDQIGFTNRMRRNAVIEVQPTAHGCVIKCVVERQRLDTADHRMFRQNEDINDVPNETPLERDAGLNRDQEEAWTDMPRDRALEREILSVVMNRVRDHSTTRAIRADGA